MKLKEIKPGMVIHCKTEEEANILFKEFVRLGYRWFNGKDIFKTYFGNHEDGYGYHIHEDGTVSHDNINYYKNKILKFGGIIPFSSLVIEEKTYEDGLNEAWAAAKKIVLRKEHGGLPCEDLGKIFTSEDGWETEYSVLKNLTPQEAIAKLEAYESEKQIKVGDVVFSNIFKGVVTGICNGRAFIMYDDGSSKEIALDKCQKTGKHIDISSILAEIGKE